MIDTGILAMLALGITLLVHAVVISRWSAKLDTVVKQLQEEIAQMRNVILRHDKDIEQLKIGVEVERQVRAMMDRTLRNGCTNGGPL